MKYTCVLLAICIVWFMRSQLSCLCNLDILLRSVSGIGLGALNLLHNVHALQNLAKHDMSSIEPRCRCSGDEKLAAVGVGTFCM